MNSADPSARASGDAQALATLGEALDRLGAGSARRLAEVAVLVRAFPGPEAPMVWVRAGTAGELASLMRAADAQLPSAAISARLDPKS
jgi:hypothetical protein